MEGVIIKLTINQAERLSEILQDTTDQDPTDEGWASNELLELRGVVDAAIIHNEFISA